MSAFKTFEDQEYLVLASWHNGNMIDVYGSDGLDVYNVLYEPVYQYVRDLYNEGYLADEDKDWVRDNFFNNFHMDQSTLEFVLDNFVDPEVLSIKVIRCDRTMSTVFEWGTK